jgi:hypothetical protein
MPTKAELAEAMLEAIRRYPNDVEGALIFFAAALGLNTTK